MVQTGLQRSQQVKSAQAKELAVLDCGECPFARPSAVDAFAAVVSLFVDFQYRYSPAGTLGSQRAAGDGGSQVPCLLTSLLVAPAACNRVQENCESLASQRRCAELVIAHLPLLSSAASIDAKKGTRRMAMIWQNLG